MTWDQALMLMVKLSGFKLIVRANRFGCDTDLAREAHDILIAHLDEREREVLAALFVEEYSSGIFNALHVLHAARLAPFDEGYDGEPSDDFLGRMDGWDWPERP